MAVMDVGWGVGEGGRGEGGGGEGGEKECHGLHFRDGPPQFLSSQNMFYY
jgi:hypothetical protein